MLEIEFILNSRPLCEVGNSEVITPAHFLNCNNSLEKEISAMDKELFFEEVLKSRKDIPALFRQVQILRDQFWKNLWSQYLDKLRFAYDNTQNRFVKKPNIGEVCIIWDDGPRNGWKKGVILELIYSEDEQLRSCKVQTSNGVIIRPLKLLYSLELSETDTLDREFHQEIKNDIKYNNNPNSTLYEDTDHAPKVDNGGDNVQSMTKYKRQRKAKIDALGKIKKVIDVEKRV